MKSIAMQTAALAAAALMSCHALAQESPKANAGGAAGAAPAGAAGGGAGAGVQRLLQGGAAGGETSPGMKPAAGAQTEPGQRQPGENAGVSPAQKPINPDQPAKASEEDQGTRKPPAEAGKKGEPGKPEATQGQAGKPADQQGQAGKAEGGARPAPKITTVQQTRIQQTIKTINVAPVHVDFHVGVGVAVPRTVVLEPVPPTIVSIVPAYEGFRFFVVPGEIVIVDPVTLEIVEVLPL